MGSGGAAERVRRRRSKRDAEKDVVRRLLSRSEDASGSDASARVAGELTLGTEPDLGYASGRWASTEGER